jgi:3-dehydroquinate synthase
VAATFMRGIRLVKIPTTLLAQVDSSVGGKVGVNHPLGKNTIGTFYHPEFVLIDPTMLRTLPVRELRAGLAEVVKVALIQDAHLFVILQKNITGVIRLDDLEFITGLIHASCAIKARIVKKDEREQGIRVILNFGHTIGHALEAATHYEYFRHGEAVTLGMAAAVKISIECGHLQAGAAEQIWQLLRHLQAPDIPADLTTHDVMAYLQYDKKRLSTGQRWVLLNHIGSAIVVSNIPEGVIHHAIEFLFDFNARP